jgi:hypothetical protein
MIGKMVKVEEKIYFREEKKYFSGLPFNKTFFDENTTLLKKVIALYC